MGRQAGGEAGRKDLLSQCTQVSRQAGKQEAEQNSTRDFCRSQQRHRHLVQKH